jgi:hypothetical protein
MRGIDRGPTLASREGVIKMWKIGDTLDSASGWGD